MYVYDEFEPGARYVSSFLCLGTGIASIVLWTPYSLVGALSLSGLLILLSVLLFLTRVYIKIDDETRTYEFIRGVLGLSRIHTGDFSDISHVVIDRTVEASQYSSREYFPVSVHIRAAIGKDLVVQKSAQFEKAARFAKKLSQVIGVPVQETPALREIRNRYMRADYDQIQIDETTA